MTREEAAAHIEELQSNVDQLQNAVYEDTEAEAVEAWNELQEEGE